MSDASIVLRKLREIEKHPASDLSAVIPAIRGIIQALRRERLRATRVDHLLEAETWRLCLERATSLLQRLEDRDDA